MLTDPIFVCMADHAYLKWIRYCVPAILRQHPAAKIYLFDLSSDTSKALADFAAPIPAVIHVSFPEREWKWPAWIDQKGFDFFWPNFTLRESLKYWSRRLRRTLGQNKAGWMTDKAKYAQNLQRFCRIVSQKPHVLLHVLQETSADIVFVDVDAIILKPVNGVFGRTFDLCVTVEEPEDVVIDRDPPNLMERVPYPIRAINTGVIFLRNHAATEELLYQWIEEMEKVEHGCVEQTALANLIYRHNPKFFETAEGDARWIGNSQPLCVAGVPMVIYNNIRTRLEKNGFPDGISVGHFVGGLKRDENWSKVEKLLKEQQ